MKALRKILNSGKTEPPAAIEPESPETHPRLRNPCSTDLGSRERTLYRYPAVSIFFFLNNQCWLQMPRDNNPLSPHCPVSWGSRVTAKPALCYPGHHSRMHPASIWERLGPSAPPGTASWEEEVPQGSSLLVTVVTLLTPS